MKEFGLPKAHKLCSKIAVERLFGRVDTHAALAYPVRAVWAENPGRGSGEDVQFLISIPKKRLRHAVDRVKMRRRVREAYRLNRGALVPESVAVPVDIAFIYVANELTDYKRVQSSVRRLLRKIFPVSERESSSGLCAVQRDAPATDGECV